LMIRQQATRACIHVLHRAGLFPLANARIMDIGCGNGNWLLEFLQWGASPEKLSGIDLSAARIASAQHRLPSADLRTASATELPWEGASFDLVTQFTVFTSILDRQMQQQIAAEMQRVLKPGGSILWFDFRYSNPRNPNVRGIGRSEIKSLFPNCRIDFRSTVLAPPVADLAASLSWAVGEILHAVPVLRTHYAALITKK
jgi:ubiquinone/menaquinone biosynthesis C-methylase UbiE